jgi:hypothetical protein
MIFDTLIKFIIKIKDKQEANIRRCIPNRIRIMTITKLIIRHFL